jgi:hypothetical protein
VLESLKYKFIFRASVIFKPRVAELDYVARRLLLWVRVAAARVVCCLKEKILVPNSFVPDGIILNQSGEQYMVLVNKFFLRTHPKKMFLKYESASATKSLTKRRCVSNWRWDCMTLRLGQMLHRERREIAQGRHRGLAINLAQVTVAILNWCTDCLASLGNTVFIYAPFTEAALKIQTASQASIATI